MLKQKKCARNQALILQGVLDGLYQINRLVSNEVQENYIVSCATEKYTVRVHDLSDQAGCISATVSSIIKFGRIDLFRCRSECPPVRRQLSCKSACRSIGEEGAVDKLAELPVGELSIVLTD